MFQTGSLRPPDPHGAAGSNGIIATVNLRVAYFNKTGGLIWGPVSFTTFFSPVGNTGANTDPRAIYDPVAARFYIVLLENSTSQSFVNLAVSKNPNPLSSGTSDWFFYRVEVTESFQADKYALDYPGLGYDAQAIYVTGNMESLPLTESSVFKNCQIVIFKKTDALSGTATFSSAFTPDGSSSGFTLQPATVLGNSAPTNRAYFAETPLNSSTTVRIWALSDPLGTRSLTSASVTIPNNGGTSSIDDAPQAGTTNKIPTIAPYTQGNAFWWNGQIWFCHTAGGSSGKSIVYFYKINANNFPSNTPTLGEAGGIDGGSGVWNYQPAIGGNARGDVCMVYCQSSSTTFPAIYCVARAAGETNFGAPILLKQSPAFSNSDRWGDFATVSADPGDGTFWVCHEWAKSSAPHDWSTWWAQVSVGQPLITALTVSNPLVQLNWTSISGRTYRVQFKPDFLQTNWNNLAGDVTATNSISTKTDSLTIPSRFYRISLLP